jgi:DUF4097 and DUF4098 domain-containing protein YvlB
MKRMIPVVVLAAAMLAALPARAQDRVTVNFTDPSKPGLLRVNTVNGSISVKTHAGTDVILEGKSLDRGRQAQTRDGLRRIDSNNAGLTIEEENNVMTVSSRGSSNSGNIEIQVPAKTNLRITTVNGGAVTVDDVEGEIEVNNTNGNIVLNNVAGSVIAHATNGRLVASLRDMTANQPMSFITQNSNVDITLPPTAKANLKMRTDNGEAYTDFDIQLRPATPPVVEDNRNRGGRFRIQTDRTINGTINGGGPDFEIRTLNGNIYLRKGK